MFIGHFGIGLAANRIAPKTSLGMLFFAAQFPDFLWSLLLLLDMEHVRISPGITLVTPLDFHDYPISHSLLAVILWSAALAAVYLARCGYRPGAWVVGGLISSHWILDAVVHRPDLPLAPGSSTYFGLGLWNSWPATLAVELMVFLLGVLMYLRSTCSKDRIGSYGIWLFAAFLVGGWLSTLLAGPPPNTMALAWGALFFWLLIPLANWIDGHRGIVP
jgi:hypothetical protein